MGEIIDLWANFLVCKYQQSRHMRGQLHSPNCTSPTSNCTKHIKELLDTLLVLTSEDTKKGMDRVINF